MSNTYSANVIRIDTSAAFEYARRILSVKYIAGSASPSASIYSNGASTGSLLWEGGSTSTMDHDLNIHDNQGVYVSVSGGSIVYLYLDSFKQGG